MIIEASPIFYFRNSADRERLSKWRQGIGDNLVFTNGVFDIIHAGHVSYLREARNLGEALVVGLNSDASVRRIKGPKRPLQEEPDRAGVLASLRSTDAVVIFDEETPLEIISFILPNTLVKGGDYTRETIVGRDVVESHGGRVLPLPFVDGRSTSGIVERIVERYGSNEKR